jgi:hypothetical protein
MDKNNEKNEDFGMIFKENVHTIPYYARINMGTGSTISIYFDWQAIRISRKGVRDWTLT